MKYFTSKKQKQKVLARMIELAKEHWGQGMLDSRHYGTGERTMCLLGLAGASYREVTGKELGQNYISLGALADELSIVTLIRAKRGAAGLGIYADTSADDTVVAWNDSDDRTQRQVLNLLRKRQAELA